VAQIRGELKNINSMGKVSKQEFGGKKNAKFNPNFNQARVEMLNQYMQIVNSCRPGIIRKSSAALCFLRFISPTQYGDQKPPGFVFPFKIEQTKS
jgi:hypothetical protein